MPNAVTHVIIAIVIIDLVRDYVFKKKGFPLYLVLIGGIFALLPDLDVLVGWFMGTLEYHRVFTHNFVVTLVFGLIAFVLWYFFKKKVYWKIVLVAGAGYLIHVLMDLVFSGYVYPLWPLSSLQYGLQLVPTSLFSGTVYAGLDAIILIVWLVHEYWQHNIRDYI